MHILHNMDHDCKRQHQKDLIPLK